LELFVQNIFIFLNGTGVCCFTESKMQNSKSLSSFKKIPNRYTSIVLPFLLSIIMTFVVSMVSTLRSLGLEEFSIYVWMPAWTISWLIAFPTLLLVLPVVRKITAILVQPA